MARIWGTLRRKEKIVKEHISVFQDDFPAMEDIMEGLCTALDIPRPVILTKHENEYGQFGRTVLYPSDFVENVDFARFEVEYLKDKKKRER